jgi:hypothetical protein
MKIRHISIKHMAVLVAVLIYILSCVRRMVLWKCSEPTSITMAGLQVLEHSRAKALVCKSAHALQPSRGLKK